MDKFGVALLAIWLTCGAVTYGGIMAEFWHESPRLQVHPKRCRELAARSLSFALAGPFGLIAVTVSTAFFWHGLMYECPPK